ncbi:hypothetical protein CL656_06110 [bacterium]|nr:hypothetical protein [bacterium]|tara:strand:+ start:828 stop:1106 length:279 start_codon:yes stop_codon:yes gene_type:complete
MEENINYNNFRNKIKKNNLDEIQIREWYNNQKLLLEEYIKTTNETLNNNDNINLLVVLFNQELNSKVKMKEMKENHKYFRRTLKKRKLNLNN